MSATTAHRHDGFYFRAGIGIGFGSAKSKGNAGGIDLEATYSGAGPAYELLFGGTVARGLVIGGGFVGQDISSPTVRLSPDVLGLNGNITTNGALGVVVVGPFIDWFPDEHGGAHLGGMLGIGGIGLKDDNDRVDTGAGISIWGGYDFWVSDQWSLGGEARAGAMSAKRTVGGETFDDSATTLEFLFTALYH